MGSLKRSPVNILFDALNSHFSDALWCKKGIGPSPDCKISLSSILEKPTSVVQYLIMMAASAPSIISSRAVIASVLGDEDLSHEQIQQLLQQAEIRLKEKIKSADTKNRPTQYFSKLDTGTVSQPYIKSNGGICRVDSSCLVEKDVRDLAEQPRKAILLSVEKKRLAEVRHHRRSHFLYYRRFPYIDLDLPPLTISY